MRRSGAKLLRPPCRAGWLVASRRQALPWRQRGALPQLFAVRLSGGSAARPARSGLWEHIPVGQRLAWEALGWTAESWTSRRPAPVTSLKHWAELSSGEQAAARHGLGFDGASWDRQLDDAQLHSLVAQPGGAASSSAGAAASEASVQTAAASPQASSASAESSQSLGQLLERSLPWVRTVAQFLPRNSKLRVATEVIGGFADAALEARDAVPLEGTEDVLFLDDSGSMLGSRLIAAQDLWRDLATRMQANPTRVVKFGSGKIVLQHRATGVSANAVALAWNAQSGETYMWHMILEDIQSCYRVGPGRLRVFIVTDGGDNRSPPPYQGMGGMDPMMQDLLALGYNLEFHIVFVSSALERLGKSLLGAESASPHVRRYKDLALATGGSFLHLTGSDEGSDRAGFLERAAGSCGVSRDGARREYERQLGAGEATQFPWYERLPPPSR